MRLSRPSRHLVPAIAATLIVAGLSGCHWFKKDTGYQLAESERPLEVPPDLDLPDTQGGMQLPGEAPRSVMRSSIGASSAEVAASGFTVAGEQAAMFDRVGDVLEATSGVTIASRAQVLGVYDVSYEGVDFLVRVSKVDAGVYISAVDPRGMPASGEAASKLIATLKAAL